MTPIDEALEQSLETCQLTRQEFSELLIRLLEYGVLCRDESQVEEQLYDRFLRCRPLLEAWLAPMAFRLQHDAQFQFVRLYPPGARVPGMIEDESQQPFNSGLRARLGQQEVAAALVLRVEYDKAIREARVDERGHVLISLETLGLGLRNLLKRSLPDTRTERRQMLVRLRQLRLIQYNAEDNPEDEQIWLRVRPTIVPFVSEATLNSVLDSEQNPPSDDEEPSDHVS